MNTVLMLAIVFVLFLVDWLTFHDIFEPHTARDWLTLLASFLVFAYFAKEAAKKLTRLVKSRT